MSTDRGSSTVETVVAISLLMLTIMAGMQLVLLFFARSVALAAAQEGVRAARAEGASRTAGGTVARDFAQRTASGFLLGISASSAAGGGSVRVTVRGQALTLVPFISAIEVEGLAAGPLEEFSVERR
jgi:Flp pilus assembly protein TadG